MVLRYLLMCLVLAGCATAPGRWESQLQARAEARLRNSPQRLHDPALEAWLGDWLRRIDPVHGTQVRAYVLNLPAPQAELLGENVLRVRLGLLLALRDEAELAFVLAHELAHRSLGHVSDRQRPDWDAQAAERDADRTAVETLIELGYSAATGAQLLTRLRNEVPSEDDRALIDVRIAALATQPFARSQTPAANVRLMELLAPYRRAASD